MLIRREVYFSQLDEQGVERLYSTTEIVSEESYLERLYAEAEEEEPKKKGLSKGAKIALGTAAAAATATGAVIGGKKLGAKMVEGASKRLGSALNENAVRQAAENAARKAGKKGVAVANAGNKAVMKETKNLQRRVKVGEALQKPADAITGVAKRVATRVEGAASQASQKVQEGYYRVKGKVTKK